MNKYEISLPVTANGEQVYSVLAETEEEAHEKLKKGECELIDECLEADDCNWEDAEVIAEEKVDES